MDSSLIALMMLSLLLGCGCWLLFLWAVRDGQFTDIERAKYRMLDDEESPPRREDTGMAGDPSSDPAVLPLPGPPPPSLPAEALAKAGEGVVKKVDLVISPSLLSEGEGVAK